MRYLEERQAVLDCAREIYTSGMVTGTWGNVSLRVTGKLMIITPSGMDYETLEPEDMVLLDFSGQVVEGKYRPSIETSLHLGIYQRRSDINAVVHVHSPYAVAFAVARKNIPVILEETAQVIGHEVEVAAYARCGSQQLADIAVQALGEEKKALLLANHGLIALGQDIPEALKICYIVEKTAMISVYASVLGTPHSLFPEDVSFLNQSSKSYGQKKDGDSIK